MLMINTYWTIYVRPNRHNEGGESINRLFVIVLIFCCIYFMCIEGLQCYQCWSEYLQDK